jgi:casein kinase I family protein HRR25
MDPVPAYWTVTSAITESLLQHFKRLPAEIKDTETSTDPDIRADARMRKHLDYNIYVKLSALQPYTLRHTLDGAEIDWESKRGWFDDLVKISKRRSADAGWQWTATNRVVQNEDDEFSNSYYAPDVADWDTRQQERDRSLTLEPGLNDLLDQQIRQIVRVE